MVESFKEYGKLSRQDLDQLQAGARIEINGNQEKSNGFRALENVERKRTSWPSPWGLVVLVCTLNVQR